MTRYPNGYCDCRWHRRWDAVMDFFMGDVGSFLAALLFWAVLIAAVAAVALAMDA